MGNIVSNKKRMSAVNIVYEKNNKIVSDSSNIKDELTLF